MMLSTVEFAGMLTARWMVGMALVPFAA
jgi:hypothetical protein